MADLDQTIEDLEKEVKAELEEAAHDAPTKGAGKSDPMPKMKNGEKPEEVPGPTPEKDANMSGKPDASKKVKKDSSAPTKGAVPPEKGSKMKEGFTDEEIRTLCHTKDHDCATVVEHPVWGKGKPLHASHAVPDDDGYVAWYDVTFKHGIERNVMAEDMKILVSETHEKEEEKDPKKMKKDELITAMKDMTADKHTKDELIAMYNGMKDGMKKPEEDAHMGDKEKEDDEEMDEKIKEEIYKVNVDADVNALTEGENFSDEFKTKAKTIFEAAVSSKIASIEDIMVKSHNQKLAEAKEDMVDKVDSYLNYVTEEWKKENELAIERGLKGEIAEDFITGLKSLFEDHYIDVPDEKYDILEAQSLEIDELKKKVNDLMESGKTHSNRIGELVRESMISEVSSDLTETGKEKFKSLTEDVEFTDEKGFKDKLSTLKNSYFPSEQKKEEVLSEDTSTKEIDSSDAMAAYSAAIQKTHKRAMN
tara:strand:- start:686 stop:2116 length:1431 start_codon:yes stop_codon:yes gene_type:complete